MLVSAKEMTAAARAGHYAIGAFNLNNLEWTKAVLKAAQECNAPVIVQCSEGAGKYMAGYKMVADMVNDVIASQGVFRSPRRGYTHRSCGAFSIPSSG